MKTMENDAKNYIRVGALVQRGWRHLRRENDPPDRFLILLTSHSIAICAGVSATLPSVALGQGK